MDFPVVRPAMGAGFPAQQRWPAPPSSTLKEESSRRTPRVGGKVQTRPWRTGNCRQKKKSSPDFLETADAFDAFLQAGARPLVARLSRPGDPRIGERCGGQTGSARAPPDGAGATNSPHGPGEKTLPAPKLPACFSPAIDVPDHRGVQGKPTRSLLGQSRAHLGRSTSELLVQLLEKNRSLPAANGFRLGAVWLTTRRAGSRPTRKRGLPYLF